MPHFNDTAPPQRPLIGAEATALLEHEWRTPMTVIKSAAEVLRDHEDLSQDERHALLDALIAEAARLHSSLECVLVDGNLRCLMRPHGAP